jgi:putative DNA primase/helicase
LDFEPGERGTANWQEFLKQIYDDEQDQIDALQEMFGYCLCSDVSQEKAIMWLGPKRSGKDTKRTVLQALLPQGAVCGPTLDSMGTQFGMEQFLNKQLAIVGDMRIGSKCDKDLLAENVLKLTGRGLFTIPRKYKSAWTGTLPCKLLAISNEMPPIKDTSGALASRFLIFNTRRSFYGKEDPNLFRDKLRPELSGICNWALDGLRRMRERGRLAEPDCSVEAREQLARDGSPVLAFAQECLVLERGAETETAKLFSAWLDYATTNNLHPGNKDWFVRNLVAATGSKVQRFRMSDAKRTKALRGVRLGDQLPSRAKDPDMPF